MKIVSELWDGIVYVLQVVIMTAFMTLFLGMLFAPAFEGVLAHDLQLKAAGMGATTLSDLTEANRKMTLTRIGLWLTCFGAWTFLIAANVVYWGIH